jgi:hypothetical protein
MLIAFQGALFKLTLPVALAFLVPAALAVALGKPHPTVALAIVLASLIGVLRTLFTGFRQVAVAASGLKSHDGSTYRLGAIVGAGGMGVVYRALSPRKVPVAVKCLHPIWFGDEQQRKRLMREALIVNTIDHPGVVPIIDHGEVENVGPFLVMDLLSGRTPGQSHQNASRHDPQNTKQVSVVPACEQALVLDAKLLPVEPARNSLEKIDGDVADDSEVFSGVTSADTTVVFSECDVQHPVKFVLDSPVSAGGSKRSICGDIGT